MPHNIFYSWQSDRDPKTTRRFIREALDLAVSRLANEMEIEDVVRVDQDTQDVPGHPEIFRAICEKIETCAIFVADLTCVATTEDKSLVCNPNVAIEFGYALKAVGSDRFITVMNTAYGGPEHLPFDLQHRRWPIRYELPSKSTPDKQRAEKEKLVDILVTAIRTILESGAVEANSPADTVEATPSTSSPAIFFDESQPFAIHEPHFQKSVELHVPPGAKTYLRVIPTRRAPELDSAGALDIVRAAVLEPMRLPELDSGISFVRNSFGAAAVAIDRGSGQVYGLTQLMKKTRELWGIDALTINEDDLRGYAGTSFGFLPISMVERSFNDALANIIRVAKERLGLTAPLRLIAGVVGVQNYRMGLNIGYRGRLHEDQVSYTGMIERFDVVARDLLLPFYKKLWGECGLARPDGFL